MEAVTGPAIGDTLRYFGRDLLVVGFDPTGELAVVEDREERERRDRARGAMEVLKEWRDARPGDVPAARIEEARRDAEAAVVVARVRLDLLTYTDGAWVRQ
jgi:hypothetical protein